MSDSGNGSGSDDGGESFWGDLKKVGTRIVKINELMDSYEEYQREASSELRNLSREVSRISGQLDQFNERVADRVELEVAKQLGAKGL